MTDEKQTEKLMQDQNPKLSQKLKRERERERLIIIPLHSQVSLIGVVVNSSLSSFDSVASSVAASSVFSAGPLIARPIAIFLSSVIVDPTTVGRLLYKE